MSIGYTEEICDEIGDRDTRSFAVDETSGSKGSNCKIKNARSVAKTFNRSGKQELWNFNDFKPLGAYHRDYFNISYLAI